MNPVGYPPVSGRLRLAQVRHRERGARANPTSAPSRKRTLRHTHCMASRRLAVQASAEGMGFSLPRYGFALIVALSDME
jgi:hypothetical protein